VRRKGGELHRAANDERVWSDEEASERSGAKLAKAVIADHLPTNIGM
jgi:hypothetical protein